MFFLESKHVLDAATVDHTLVVNKDGARLQKMMDNTPSPRGIQRRRSFYRH